MSMAPSALADTAGRRIRYLRVSLTDRCNYRCAYCMPPGGWGAIEREKLPRATLPSLEEVAQLVELLAELGVERVRLTGGEPLLRRGVPQLVGQIAALPGVGEVVMTTNGALLERSAVALRAAGLSGLSVSLDTLSPERFEAITRGGRLSDVIGGLLAAGQAGFENININAVAIRGLNELELPELAAWCWRRGYTPRFIELMPVGALAWVGAGRLVPGAEVLCRLGERFPLAPEPIERSGPPRGPAAYWSVQRGDFVGRRVGLISPMTDPAFCGTCNRARLTARGGLRACLASDDEIPLLTALRRGAPREALVELIRAAVQGKRPAHQMSDGALVPVSAMTGIGG